MTVQHGVWGALLLLSLVSSAGIVTCAHNPQDQSVVSVSENETATQTESDDERAGRAF